MTKKIKIGFLGLSHLGLVSTIACAEKGYEVICFDITPPKVNEDKNLPYQMIWGSILNPYEIDKAIKGCETVIHLAAVVGVEITEKKSLLCLHINIQGTSNVLDSAVKNKVKK